MCLFTTQIEPKIAKHNIKCWKFINDWTYKTWVPVYIYETGELSYNCVLKPKNKQGKELEHLNIIKSNYVEEGFYAYKKKPDPNMITYNTFRLRRNLKLVRVIIPKGSEYIENHTEIVALEMIVFRTWWDYIKWGLNIK